MGMVLAGDGFEGKNPPEAPNVARALLGSTGPTRRGLSWDGGEAMRFRPASAKIVVPPLSNHLVVLHLGGPIEVAQGADGGLVREKLVGRGGSAVVPAGSATEWRWRKRDKGEADSLHLYLAPSLIRDAAEDAGLDFDGVELVGSLGTYDQQIERIGLSLLPDLAAGGLLGGGLYAEALARALAMHLLRDHSSLGRSAGARVSREPEDGLPRMALRRAVDYVGDNLAGDLALVRIARVANVSPYHFSRLFKESTGLSPHQYVIRQRVEKARELLKGTDLPLHEVAAAAGFAHQSHMGRHLKRLLGVSPTRLRRG